MRSFKDISVGGKKRCCGAEPVQRTRNYRKQWGNALLLIFWPKSCSPFFRIETQLRFCRKYFLDFGLLTFQNSVLAHAAKLLIQQSSEVIGFFCSGFDE